MTLCIQQLQSKLGPTVCDNILVAHAFTGCDTASRIYGIGKSAVLQHLAKQQFLNTIQVFGRSDATQDEIVQAGENTFKMLLGAKTENELKRIRYQRYIQKVLKKKVAVEARDLPPTSAAARFHSLRVYLQCREWCGDVRNPEHWGWKINGKNIYPIYTDNPPAPSDILKIIRCNCSAGCSTSRCSCRRQGLTCSSSCGCTSCCTNQECAIQEDEQAEIRI